MTVIVVWDAFLYIFVYRYIFYACIYTYTFKLIIIKTLKYKVDVPWHILFRGAVIETGENPIPTSPQAFPCFQAPIKARGSLGQWKGLPRSQVFLAHLSQTTADSGLFQPCWLLVLLLVQGCVTTYVSQEPGFIRNRLEQHVPALC